MVRALWRGYIVIGQLGIPVRLYGATRGLEPRFVLLHEPDRSPVERVLQCRAEHRPIAGDEVIRAVEYAPGEYVPLARQELERALSGPVKTIAVRQFCDVRAVPPLYYDRPYYVVPSRGGERAYALLRDVFTRLRRMAVAQFRLHNRERIGMLRQEGDLLLLLGLRFTAELLPRSQLPTPPLPKPSPQEITALSSVVERFSGPLHLQDYHNEYAERMQALVARKARGLPAPRPQRSSPHATPEADILSSLERTLGGGPVLQPAPVGGSDRGGA